MQIGEAVKVDEFKNLGSAAKGRGRCTREVTSIGRMIVGPALMYGVGGNDKKTGRPGWTRVEMSASEGFGDNVRPRRDIEYEAATPEKKRKTIEKIHR